MTDVEELESLITLALTEPSEKQLCQHLALVSFADVGCWAVAIFIQDRDLQLMMVGQFGLDPESELRLTEMPHLVRGEVLSGLAQDRYVSNISGIDCSEVLSVDDFAVDFGPILIAPLRIPSQMFGLVVTFLLDETIIEETVARMHRLRDAISVNVLHDFRLQPFGDSQSELPTSLTERQSEILQCMSEGKTNTSIAMHIGFSESTVRHETMRIYRFLGVHDRKQAVIEAERRGLISGRTSRV